ncbi:MAG: ATP-binding protein [Nanoarchaeota archaeon]
MEKAQIIEILEDWNFWTKDHNVGIPREEYLQKLTKLAETEQIIVVLGVRRSGKSTIMHQYIKKLIDRKVDPKNILYVNFEDVRFGEFSLELLNQIYDVYLEYAQPDNKQYIFLDEVQKIKGWEKFARTLHELKKAQVFVSGSNSKLLWGELSSVLTGRHLDLTVYPLEFSEFLMFKKIEVKDKLDLIAKRHKIKALLNEYLHYGGFPLVCLKEPKKELLQTYFEDIINKDVIEKKIITHVSKIKSLAKFYLTNVGRRISFRSISKFQELSLDTIERYSYYLEEAYLISFIKKFSYSVKEQEKTMSVVYAIDNGLRNLVSFKFSQDDGWLYQNTVANSLIKRFGKDKIFYWTSPTKEEVDFVVKPGLKVKQLIQVCYNIADPATKKREATALVKASKELKCSDLLAITEGYEAEEKFDNKKIRYIPLWKYLCQQFFP